MAINWLSQLTAPLKNPIKPSGTVKSNNVIHRDGVMYDAVTGKAVGSSAITQPKDIDNSYQDIDTNSKNPVVRKTGSTGSGSVSQGPSQAQLDQMNSQLAQLDTLLANKNRTATDAYNQTVRSYDDMLALDRQARDKATQQNETALTEARQAAKIQAAQGGAGLKAVLASMNALGGTGAKLANQAVAREANIDIGNADKNFRTNADNLTSSWAATEDADKRRREEARTIRDNELSQNRAETLTSRQSMLNTLAGMYDKGTAQANNYLTQATSLNPEIVNASRKNVAQYQKASQLFSPQKLQEYLGGVRDLQVNTAAGASGAPVNSSIFATSDDKRRRTNIA